MYDVDCSLYLAACGDLFQQSHLNHNSPSDGALYLFIVRILILYQVLDDVALSLLVFFHIINIHVKIAACFIGQLGKNIFLQSANKAILTE